MTNTEEEKIDIQHEQVKEIELMKFSADLEKTALTQSFILNGGALVAVVAFAGNALTKSNSTFAVEKYWLISSILSWGISLCFITIAIFLSKCSQHYFLKSIRGKISYSETKDCRFYYKKEDGSAKGQNYRIWSNRLLLTSIIGFLLGISCAAIFVWNNIL